MKPAILLLLVLNACLHVSGQQKEYIFKNFTQEEGLPSNEAYYVFEDSRHFLWFATDLGVVRYNGNKFEQFNLPDNVVFKIREDSKGRIWFFSHKAQLAYFENEKIVQFGYNEKIAENISKINIVDAYVDQFENIHLSSSMDSNYLISNAGKISAFNRTNYTDNISTDFTVQYFSDKNICYVENVARANIKSSLIYIRINTGLKDLIYRIPLQHVPYFSHFGCIQKKGVFYFFAGKFLFKLQANGAFEIQELPSSILCLEFENEYLRVGLLKNGTILLDENLTVKPSYNFFENRSLTSFISDLEGGRWYTTLESGVFYIKNAKINSVNDSSKKTDKNILRLFNEKNSSLIYSTSSGLYKIKSNQDFLIQRQKASNYSDLFIDSMNNLYCFGGFEFRNDTINRIIKSRDHEFRRIYYLTSPFEPAFIDDKVYYAQSYRVTSFKTDFINSENYKLDHDTNLIADKLFTLLNKPLRLFKDKQNSIWGGYQDGLYKLNFLLDTFIQILPRNLLLKKGITCIRQMDNNLITVGIRFNGVALLNDTNLIANITEKDGLLSDKVRFILPIRDQLWVATAKGISVIKFTSYDPIKFNIINIGKNDGFYNVTINQLIQFKGDIVAATSNGLYFIKDPDELINRKPIPIPFYINSVSYDQNDTSTAKSLDLPYSKSRVLLRYSAVCFNSAEEVKYQYTFSSADTGWITTTSNELLLENLEPGDYDFRIKAIIPNQNRSSDIQHFHITVEKPWWQNNWFRAAVIILFISAGILFSKYRIKKIQADEERKTALNAKIAELEQTALRAQMNPHFIFNCLTSIQQLIVTGDKTEANEYLVKFARLIRKTLDLSANPFITIKEEIEYLSEYMFLEQLRITDRFDYEITADKTIDKEKIFIPNMMIQPVVENCIRHGIKSLENRKGLIKVDFSFHKKQLICTVRDNGIGRNKSKNETELVKHKSYGIDIIEKRLKVFEELNDEPMGIEIKDLFAENGNAEGTEVILQLPYKSIV